MNLSVRSARVSSDGGWFVDEFRISNLDGTKVTDLGVLDRLTHMLDIKAETSGEASPVTVIEITGPDRPRLFGDLVNMLQGSGSLVKSVAAWTFKQRCAFTIAVVDRESGRSLPEGPRLETMKAQLWHTVAEGTPDALAEPPTVAVESCPGDKVHHERRLHRLMLDESQRAYDLIEEGGATPGGTPGRGASPVPGPLDALPRADAGAADGGGPVAEGGADVDSDNDNDDNDCLPSDELKPDVTIMEGSSGYWEVLIHCADRPKLTFDAVCTLADLNYEIYHATVDIVEERAFLEFYIRPGTGEVEFDEVRARRLTSALATSINRRFPQGRKLHLQLSNLSLVLGDILTTMGQHGLNITRARVVDDSQGTHALYVMREDGGFPSRRMIEDVCRKIGGAMLPVGCPPAAVGSVVSGSPGDGGSWKAGESIDSSRAAGILAGAGSLEGARGGSLGKGGMVYDVVKEAADGAGPTNFTFKLCDRKHRRDKSAQGLVLSSMKKKMQGGLGGLEETDLSRAQSSADLSMYDWSRYSHRSKKALDVQPGEGSFSLGKEAGLAAQRPHMSMVNMRMSQDSVTHAVGPALATARSAGGLQDDKKGHTTSEGVAFSPSEGVEVRRAPAARSFTDVSITTRSRPAGPRARRLDTDRHRPTPLILGPGTAPGPRARPRYPQAAFDERTRDDTFSISRTQNTPCSRHSQIKIK